ncbi:MAG: MFS transporter, partial [Clostridiales bacterium]|nr:MFS transporter [Clostridiales bacterium]
MAIFSGYLIFGFSENIKGPAVPRIQADFSLSAFQVGLLLATNSLAYLTACGYTAALSRKIGSRMSLTVALTVMAAAGACICFAPAFPVLALSYFLMYLGNGMLEIVLGLMAAAAFTKNTGAKMNLAHGFYGLSSCVSPMLSAGLMGARFGTGELGWRYMYLIVLSSAFLPVIPALLCRLPGQGGTKNAVDYRKHLKDPSAWLVIALLSLGVTCEMGAGGWLVNFAEKARGFSENEAALALTAFFVCFTLARLALGPLADKLGFERALMLFTGFAAAATVAGVLSGRFGIGLLAAAGFGIGPVYPTVMALTARMFRRNLEAAITVTLIVVGGGIVL